MSRPMAPAGDDRIGVEEEHVLAARELDPFVDCVRKTGVRAIHDQLHPWELGSYGVRRVVTRVVVDDDHFERREHPLVVERMKAGTQRLLAVVAHHDHRDDRRCVGFHGSDGGSKREIECLLRRRRADRSGWLAFPLRQTSTQRLDRPGFGRVDIESEMRTALCHDFTPSLGRFASLLKCWSSPPSPNRRYVT